MRRAESGIPPPYPPLVSVPLPSFQGGGRKGGGGKKSCSQLVPLLQLERFLESIAYALKPLAELYSKSSLLTAKRISNPGCFATNTQLLLAPLLHLLDPLIQPTIFGISGYSGAGTKSGSVPKISPQDLHTGGLRAGEAGVRLYSLTDHIHEREASFHLSSLLSEEQRNKMGGQDFSLAFIPSVAPWYSGILSTLSVPLLSPTRHSEIKSLYEAYYSDSPLIKITSEVPEVGDVAGKNGVRIGGMQVHSEGKRVVVVSVLDNLLKGAATQCLQVRPLSFHSHPSLSCFCVGKTGGGFRPSGGEG